MGAHVTRESGSVESAKPTPESTTPFRAVDTDAPFTFKSSSATSQ